MANEEEDNDINIEYFLKSLDNDRNLSVSKLTYDKINNMKYNSLMSLQMTHDEIEPIILKLSNYRVIHEIQDFVHGAYIRHIPKNKTPIMLKNGGFLCDIKINTDGIHILCRNQFKKIFQLRFDDVLIFQSLTRQEELILKVFEKLSHI